MTDIGKTASITLLTGLPGSGKTLRMVHWIDKAIKDGEVVFVCNLNGLKLPHIPFEDPRNWREIPAGSVLVVDEAQQFFRTRRGGEAPEYITAMETIRHMGVRLILATQQPDYLDTHLRGLVGLHEHLVRENGKPSVKIYRHNEVMDNVRSAKARTRFDSEVWQYPKRIFSLYQSAEVHSVKPTIKARFKRGVVMGIAALACIGFAIHGVRGHFADSKSDSSTERRDDSPTPRREAEGSAERPKPVTLTALDRHKPEAVEEYFANLRPRDAALPWSAPIYDDRSAQAHPRTFCITSPGGFDADGHFKPASHTCVTEQGSRVVMQPESAALLARHGEPYNPFRAPQHESAQGASAPPVELLASADPPQAVNGAAGPGLIPPAYGAMRDVSR
jgi:zona occludens toxin